MRTAETRSYGMCRQIACAGCGSSPTCGERCRELVPCHLRFKVITRLKTIEEKGSTRHTRFKDVLPFRLGRGLLRRYEVLEHRPSVTGLAHQAFRDGCCEVGSWQERKCTVLRGALFESDPEAQCRWRIRVLGMRSQKERKKCRCMVLPRMYYSGSKS